MIQNIGVTDNRPGRNPSSYWVNVPDGFTVGQFVADLSDNVHTPDQLAVTRNGSPATLNDTLASNDVLVINVAP